MTFDGAILGLGYVGLPLARQAAAAADLVILVRHHREYDADRPARIAKRFFDIRGVTTAREAHRL